MTAFPAPHCFSFSLFYTLYPHALSHALARASPYCSPSHVIVLSAHCFPMYLTSSDRHLETLVSTSCLQVSPHVLRSVDTSLNTYLSPALPVEPSSSLAAQRPARRSCLSRSSSPLRSTPSRNRDLFETWLDSSSKPVKYKNNQTHYATWCKGCFDRFEVKHAADILNIDEGNLQCDQVQSTDHWQDVG